MRCGLLGKTLGHSYSPQIHKFLGDYTYELFEKTAEELEGFLKDGDFTGLNVTVPYKKAVLPYLDRLSDRAAQLGAVNTIVRRSDGSLIGHNTDYSGFASMLARSGLQVAGKKVLVLGSGGASVTAVSVLQSLDARVIVISRSGENNYHNLTRHRDAALIVNATPVGMYPDTGVTPVALDFFPQLEGVLDIIYNPARTRLLLEAEQRGLITENGLWMLVAQAKESAEWFSGKSIPEERILQIHSLLRRQMENIILIGMPGSGKTTIGRQLAEATGKQFVDADAEIEKLAGTTIPDIFQKGGEAGFRQHETQVLTRLGKASGLVIATGGGCVTKPENYPLLHQNGSIVWLQREISALPTSGRPLSQGRDLEQMYQHRRPMYEAFADYSVENNGTIRQTVTRILQKVGYE